MNKLSVGKVAFLRFLSLVFKAQHDPMSFLSIRLTKSSQVSSPGGPFLKYFELSEEFTGYYLGLVVVLRYNVKWLKRRGGKKSS